MKTALICHARTGSTMLMDSLNMDSNITCGGEPLSSHAASIQFKDEISKLYGLYLNEKWLSPIDRKTISTPEYLEEVFAKVDVAKFLLYQLFEYPKLMRWLRDNVKIIFLRRRSLLHAYISLKIAETTKSWIGREIPQDFTITLNVQECHDRFHLCCKEERIIELFFPDCKKIWYEDLCDDWCYWSRDIQKFILGYRKEYDNLPKVGIKVINRPINKVVTNYQELVDNITELNYGYEI